MSEAIISDLSQDQLARLQPCLKKQRNGPLRYLNIYQGGSLEGYWLSDIEDIIKSNEGYVVCAEAGNGIVGFAAYTDLPWESGIFKKRMGAIKYIAVDSNADYAAGASEKLLQFVIDKAKSQNVDFLLCKRYTNDVMLIHTLEKAGFLYMGTLLDYVYDFDNPKFDLIEPPALAEGFSLGLTGSQDVDELTKVAQTAFRNHFGRFNSDPLISEQQAVNIYEEWLKSSCAGWADWILVLKKEGRIIGCSVWKKPSQLEQRNGISIGHYSIGLVHPAFQGQRLFSILTHEGMKLLRNHSRYLEGPVHINNFPVQRSYTKLGWKICDGRHSFHKWLKR